MILEKIGLADYFDAVADGNEITNSKPDPEVFLLAAQKMNISSSECIVVEDAEAGAAAARAAGMRVVGVGSAAVSPLADFRAPDLTNVQANELVEFFS